MEIRYKAHPTCARFHASKAFVRALMGPFGSGKSSACVQEVIKLAARQARGPDGLRRSRWVVVRNTYNELRDTTIRTWLHWYPPPHFGKFTRAPYPSYQMRWGDVSCEVLFRALDRPDHVRKLFSLEVTGYWINEAKEVPKAVKDALDARVGRFPARREGGASWWGGILDTNPPDTDHWWYRLFEERSPANHVIFCQPSGLSEEAENLENLPGGRGYYVNLMQGKPEDWVRVYVHGGYGFVMDGKPVYPEYHPHLHDAASPLEPVRGVEVLRGHDFGLTPATIFFQVLPGPKVRFLRELCSEEMGIERHADAVLAFCAAEFPGFAFRDWADPAGWARAQTDEKSCVDILNAKGIHPVPGAVDFVARREAMAHVLGRLSDGEPLLKIDARCVNFKKALAGGYHYRRLWLAGDERYADKPDKSHPYSDIVNAAEYAVSRLFHVPTVWRLERARARGRGKEGPRRGNSDSWATV